ncbi:hypothetical protein HMN09_00863400 [Mycena chlorophos]|uniref:Uncharacterized protein n=1 Tax=Mycena chlorophos TaxID=658473 RepID=A0A8H6SRM3_MYCCL|nr:hypothetical protein HMN09_00863400 [Mycena chlorophos]
MNNAPVSAIAIRIAAPGTSKQDFLRRTEALADEELALPASWGALSKIVLYIPNDGDRDVVKKMQLGFPPVCVLVRYEFSSDEARLQLFTNPEFNQLSKAFDSDPLSINTAFPVESTTYLDQPSVLSSGTTTTGFTIMNIPTPSDDFAGLAQSAADFHQKLKPFIEELLAIPEVQRGLTKYQVWQMSRIHRFPSRDMVESRGNGVLTRNQSTVIVMSEAADFTEIARSPAILDIANKFRETMPAFESMGFGADVVVRNRD